MVFNLGLAFISKIICRITETFPCLFCSAVPTCCGLNAVTPQNSYVESLTTDEVQNWPPHDVPLWHVDDFWAEGSWDPVDSGETSTYPLSIGTLPIIRVITSHDSLWASHRTRQTANYWTSAHLTILWMTSLPPLWSSILISDCHMCLIFLFCLWTSQACGVPICTYVIKFAYFFLLICLMSISLVDQPEEPIRVEESLLHPYTSNVMVFGGGGGAFRR